MVNLLLKWVISALVLLAVTYIVPGFKVVSLPSALVAVLVIGFLNMTLGLFLKVVTFPLAFLTLGLFFLVINALMLMSGREDHAGSSNRELRRGLFGSCGADRGAPDY